MNLYCPQPSIPTWSNPLHTLIWWWCVPACHFMLHCNPHISRHSFDSTQIPSKYPDFQTQSRHDLCTLVQFSIQGPCGKVEKQSLNKGLWIKESPKREEIADSQTRLLKQEHFTLNSICLKIPATFRARTKASSPCSSTMSRTIPVLALGVWAVCVFWF